MSQQITKKAIRKNVQSTTYLPQEVLRFGMWAYYVMGISKNLPNHTIFFEKPDEWSPTLFSKTIY